MLLGLDLAEHYLPSGFWGNFLRCSGSASVKIILSVRSRRQEWVCPTNWLPRRSITQLRLRSPDGHITAFTISGQRSCAINGQAASMYLLGTFGICTPARLHAAGCLRFAGHSVDLREDCCSHQTDAALRWRRLNT